MTLDSLLHDQRGLFTRPQARRLGYSAQQIRRRLAAGTWTQVLPSVLTLGGRPVTTLTRDHAAYLGVGGSILSGASAARLHGLPVPDPLSCVTVPRPYRRVLPGVRLLREDVPDRDRTSVDGVLVTARPRTVFDCARFLPAPAALDLLNRALQAGWISPLDYSNRVHLHAGRHGAPKLARLARLLSDGSRSAAERVAIGLFRSAGLTGWSTNHPVDRFVVDLAFPLVRLAIEIDGWAFHVTPKRFQHDRTRQNLLVGDGWTVLWFTWRDLTERPEQVIATVRETLSRLGG